MAARGSGLTKGVVEPVEATIGVGLQDAGAAGKVALGMLAAQSARRQSASST